MADEVTDKDVAAQAASGDNDTGVTDDMLNAAAADAVATQTETETEEVVEDIVTTEEEVVVAEEIEELDDEGLPVDHGKRSDLGRKVSAIHRRQDDVDARLDRILSVLEARSDTTKITESDTFDGLDADDPIRLSDLDKYLEARESRKQQKALDYDNKYLKTFSKLSAGLDEDEANAIVDEMKALSYKASDDPDRDAEVNFLKAERAYLRKQLAAPKKKVNPITGDKVKAPLGTVTSQKVVTKDTVLPKLDAAGMSYLAFVEREDGSDKAQALHKSIGKG